MLGSRPQPCGVAEIDVVAALHVLDQVLGLPGHAFHPGGIGEGAERDPSGEGAGRRRSRLPSHGAGPPGLRIGRRGDIAGVRSSWPASAHRTGTGPAGGVAEIGLAVGGLDGTVTRSRRGRVRRPHPQPGECLAPRRARRLRRPARDLHVQHVPGHAFAEEHRGTANADAPDRITRNIRTMISDTPRCREGLDSTARHQNVRVKLLRTPKTRVRCW